MIADALADVGDNDPPVSPVEGVEDDGRCSVFMSLCLAK
jgi:hypothetical protein